MEFVFKDTKTQDIKVVLAKNLRPLRKHAAIHNKQSVWQSRKKSTSSHWQAIPPSLSYYISAAQKQKMEATLKAQRKVGTVPSPSKSKRKKKRSNRSAQSAGQSSGPGNTTASLERSRRRQSDRFGDASSGAGGAGMKGKCTSCTLGALHIIDASLGLACMVYGGMAHVVTVTAIAVTYGLVLFIGAIAGAIGTYSGGCNRRGLTASAIAGLLACLADIAAFVFVIISWGSFTTFLKENAEALLLTDASINTISSLQVLFAVMFIVLAGLEGSR